MSDWCCTKQHLPPIGCRKCTLFWSSSAPNKGAAIKSYHLEHLGTPLVKDPKCSVCKPYVPGQNDGDLSVTLWIRDRSQPNTARQIFSFAQENSFPFFLFLTHLQTLPLPMKGCKFFLCSAFLAIDQWGFFSVSHLLWHGASVYNGHLRGPVTLAPDAERFVVELSLPVFTT